MHDVYESTAADDDGSLNTGFEDDRFLDDTVVAKARHIGRCQIAMSLTP